jgi:starch phosphorylase
MALWTMPEHLTADSDPESVRRALVDQVVRVAGKDQVAATNRDWFVALASLVRGYMAEHWLRTRHRLLEEDAKVVYYLSVEFLLGRSLRNDMMNLGLLDVCREALTSLGIDLDEIYGCEIEAALGNGGLGRLAACMLDSLTTQGYPAQGYGIRYDYGMFRQHIHDGWQVEQPENWLRVGNPWEIPRPEVKHQVRFGGRIVKYKDRSGTVRSHWADTDEVVAMAYDLLVSGHGSDTVNSVRLWSANPVEEFDLRHFHQGNYEEAIKEKNESENLSRVLYPDDSTILGHQLRMKQEYFFISASLQDILSRHERANGSLNSLPDKVAIHLNDTHPTFAIPEMMRLLMDVHGFDWEAAWNITTRTFAYTNHALLPEVLETWPVAMLAEFLPRHLEIIYGINDGFLRYVKLREPDDTDLLNRVSLVGEEGERHIRMAHLAIVGSHKVNGVSELHADIMRKTVFADFDHLFPDRILGRTNGISPRRWLVQANPGLAALITSHVGPGWETRLERIDELGPPADDPSFQEEFRAIKRANKERLADLIAHHLKVEVNPASMFDMHIKRIHEYKRQLLNILYVVARYNRIRAGGDTDIVPRTIIFSGKAAPGYFLAKLIIKLIHDVAAVVNVDPLTSELLQVVFIPNYDVSTAESIIPAADLSQQISTAGTEASGTGNMKLALNGALTIGTRDGANIEIGNAVGEDNIFFFGLTAEEVVRLRGDGGYNPSAHYQEQPELKEALDMIRSGHFSPDDPNRFQPIVDSLTSGQDHYMVLADFASYAACQDKVDAVYRDPAEWTRRAIVNVSKMGWFSCDRTVREYADDIWNIRPLGSGDACP